MNENEITQIVTGFTRSFVEERVRHLGQICPGFDGAPATLEMLDHLYSSGLAGTMEPQEWLTMARYAAGLSDSPVDEIRDICQKLAEWLFGIPGHADYTIPDAWADTPMGTLWWAALIRSEGDELITLSEAARILDLKGTQVLSVRIARGTLRAFTNANSRHPHQGRTLVRRSDILALRRG